MERDGYIYILENPSFPGWCKIGFTYNVQQRLAELNTETGVPYAFRVYATYKTPMHLADKYVHQIIDLLNPDLRTAETFGGKKRLREFYTMGAATAYKILMCIAEISGTKDRLELTYPNGKKKPCVEPQEQMLLAKSICNQNLFLKRNDPPQY